MDKEQIEEIRTRYDIAGSAVQYAYHIIPDAIRLSRADMPDLLDALEEAQEQNDRFQAMIVRMAKSGGRLRQALIKAEEKCRRLVGTRTADHHLVAVLEECMVCGAQFSSMVPSREQPHRDDCPFKLLEVENGATKD